MGMKAFIREFKEFIARGNVMTMAVGIIIGSAFTAIVTSLNQDIITPLLGLVLGQINFAGLSFTVGNATVTYGNFIQAVITAPFPWFPSARQPPVSMGALPFPGNFARVNPMQCRGNAP